ncbi:MAG: electron transport complex subunit RsxC [Pseudomonadota bacterium]
MSRKGLEQPLGRRLWHFPGGIKLRHWKKLSISDAIEDAGMPEVLTLPLDQRQRVLPGSQPGPLPELAVTPGQRVARYQRLTASTPGSTAHLHAPTSGTIEFAPNERALRLVPDGRHEGTPLPPMPDWPAAAAETLRERIYEAGVVGLGGALFPTRGKLTQPARILIINGAECEPYISCDEMLMRCEPEPLLKGALILGQILGAEQIVVAIEDQMGKVLQILAGAVAALDAESRISVIKVPTIYPEGGENQLIQVLTGLEVPSGGLPIDIGIVMQNVATAAACYDAVAKGLPLVSRVVSVTGRGIRSPGNFRALLGTPFAFLIDRAGGYRQPVSRLLVGGPMMGQAVADDAVPTTKATNCVLALTEADTKARAPELPCIRCGECQRVCPAQLLPQQLLWHIQDENWPAVRQHHLADCIECGCCAYVCPSQIPLVDYYRQGKAQLRDIHDRDQEAARSQARHQTRDEKQAAQDDAATRNPSDAVADAVAPARTKRQHHD